VEGFRKPGTQRVESLATAEVSLLVFQQAVVEADFVGSRLSMSRHSDWSQCQRLRHPFQMSVRNRLVTGFRYEGNHSCRRGQRLQGSAGRWYRVHSRWKGCHLSTACESQH